MTFFLYQIKHIPYFTNYMVTFIISIRKRK